ncbi:M1 family aminopeptidase [Neolewinella persica]|uniref:M1 family aminopeptidase n=1 Tax=Neolewinella persica TaxID=70998 RepID=UPI0003AA3B9F|nr:M1 family aminopeptidase [Neolewinella persica]
MLFPILQHELQHWLRQPLPWLCALVLFGISFITMWGTASEAPGGDNAEVINSGYRLLFMSTYLNNLLLFLLPTIVGAAIYRDYKSRMYTVLFSYPITKKDYLVAKFGSAMLVVMVIVCCIGLGFALGAMMPGIGAGVIGPFKASDYLLLYGIFLLPNVLLFGALVFWIVLRTRNVYLAFIAIIIVIMVQSLMSSMLGRSDLETIATLLDPTGMTGVRSAVKYWTVAERNVLAVPLTGLVVANRGLWLGVSWLLCWSAWRNFSFSQFGRQPSRRTDSENPLSGVSLYKKSDAQEALKSYHETMSKGHPSPGERDRRRGEHAVHLNPAYNFTLPHRLKTTWALSNTDFRFIVLSWPFAALLVGGFLLVFLQQSQMNPQFGFEIQPTTSTMLSVPMFIFSFVINLVTYLYVGVLAYRGETSGMGDLVDVSPQPDWVLMLSRLLAVAKVQLLLLAIVMVAGIINQTMSGYGRYEIGHYLFELFGLHFITFLIGACLATFIHTLFRNMYLGFFALLLLPFCFGAVAEIGKFLEWPFLQSGIFQFNSVPGTLLGFPYSDFFGYEPGLLYYFSYQLYWLVGGLLLLGLSLLLWKRGYVFSWRERRMQSMVKGKQPLRMAMFAGLVAFVGLGAGLYYHDTYGNFAEVSNAEYDAFLAKNELEYGQYFDRLQPRLARVNIDIDLYPATFEYRAEGTMWFVNKVDQPLDTILLATSLKEEGEYRIRNPHSIITDDEEMRYTIVRLNKPLLKGDSMALDVNIRNKENGLLKTNDRIKTNGTYLLGYHILPDLGIRNAFLKNIEKRRRFGLGTQELPSQLPTDSTLLGYSFPSNNMGGIYYETTISTSGDQRAFSTGNLVKEWTENGRNYFHYRSDKPIVSDVSWLSGRYATQRDTAGGIPLEFNYHPAHDENIPHIRQGVGASIDYCSSIFGPLEHKSLKMVEFPNSFGSHATLNGNLIPYSERMLLCDIDHENNEVFNVPFFTGAHEVAHYWWGHRVDPANVAGGRVITEGMADYLAIRITEREFGAKFSRGILKLWQELYLRERARSTDEVPLILAGVDQKRLNYRKASVAYNALYHYLGETVFNEAVADFERQYRFAPPPFASSLDFVEAFRAVTPDSLQYLLHDYFETITLYDNTLESVVVTPASNGQFQVTVGLTATKYRSDAKGTKSYADAGGVTLADGDLQSLPLADYLRLGFYAGEEELEIRQVRVDGIRNTFTFLLPVAVDRVVLDPEYLLLEVDRGSGVWRE